MVPRRMHNWQIDKHATHLCYAQPITGNRIVFLHERAGNEHKSHVHTKKNTEL